MTERTLRRSRLAAAVVGCLTVAALAVAGFRHLNVHAPSFAQESDYQGIPLTFETIQSEVQTSDVGVLSAPAAQPAVTPQAAMAVALKREPFKPAGIVIANVAVNGSFLSPTESIDAWIVSLQGGNVCVPFHGPINQSDDMTPGPASTQTDLPRCAHDHLEVFVNSQTGEWLFNNAIGYLPESSATAPTPIEDLLT